MVNPHGTIFDGRYWNVSPRGTLAHRRGGESMKNTKTMMKMSALAAMAILVAVAFVGLPVSATDCTETAYIEFPLLAGQDIEVGTVSAWCDAENIHVVFEITDTDWTITDSHVSIVAVDDCADCVNYFPHTKPGNPKIGQFAYTMDDFTDNNYVIPFTDSGILGDDDDGFEFGECLCIAAHAVVETGTGDSVQTQTGWAGDHEFPGSSWALYFCFEPKKFMVLPSDCIDYTIYNPGENHPCYWDTMVTDGASGTNVPEDTWLYGWCVEIGQTIGEGSHCGHMTLFTGNNWQIVNWIINNKDSYSWESIQAAIWWFVLGKTPALGGYVSGIYMHQADLDGANALIDIAEHHGDYCGGTWWAVLITCCTANQQEIIVEIDP